MLPKPLQTSSSFVEEDRLITMPHSVTCQHDYIGIVARGARIVWRMSRRWLDVMSIWFKIRENYG